MDGANLPLALLRGLHLAALLSMFGTLTFTVLIAPAEMRPRLMRLACGSALGALVCGAAWFTAQAAAIAGTTEWDDLLAVALHTQFGRTLGFRLLLLLAVVPLGALSRHGLRLALVPAAVAVGMQGLIGHAGAAEGSAALCLISAEAVHVLAAGAWLGSLVPLWMCLSTLPNHQARVACQRFSPLGMVSVLAIAGTALVQSVPLIGGIPGLLGTSYGLAALGKLVLFLGMLGLAAWNRFSLTGRLDAPGPASARHPMILSVMTETGCGLLVVLAAGLMASLPPGAHQPPAWPLALRPSLAALEDLDARRETALALLAFGGGLGLMAVSWIARRGRVVALLAAVPLIAWQAPSLGLLLVEAYPTSYLTSTTGFSAASIVRGRAVFASNCASCHGQGGLGDGPAAAGRRIKPADLTAVHLWDHSDGELFWWLTHGIDDPRGGLSMPGFAETLSEDDRWATIDFVRANNAGAALRVSDVWTHPVPAPDLPIACSADAANRLGALRGRFVRVIAAADTAPDPAEPPEGAIVLRLDRTTGRAPPPGGCASENSDAWRAYSTVAGVKASRLAGTEFLVDPAGWLRTIRRPKQPPDWNDRIVLSAALRTLREQPFNTPPGGIHVHGQ